MVEVPIGVHPYIVESGSKTSGWYRKWSDGIAECWMRLDLPVTSNTSTGLYTFQIKDVWSYSIFFIENPTISLTTQSSADYVFCSPYGIIRDSNKIHTIAFLRIGGMTGSSPVSIGITAKGHWK